LFLIDLTLCTTASSVDAERAFSEGRWEVGHLQHNMSSQTFKAKMATGSWSKTPLLNLDDIKHIINDHITRWKGRQEEEDGDGLDINEIEGLD